MKVWHKNKDNGTRPVAGPGDLGDVTEGTIFVTGEAPDGGPWVVALGYAVTRGCSVVRS